MALKILTISHMHPTVKLPRHGIFLQRQAKFLKALDIECTFLVPRPWAPWPLTLTNRWKEYGATNPLLKTEFPVEEVAMLRPPGRWFSRFEGYAMSLPLISIAQELNESAKFDAIWSAPMFPTAVAARLVKKKLGIPLVSLAIGSDVMVRTNDETLKKQVQRTLHDSDVCLGVSQAICRKLKELGANEPTCVYLGRDTSMFTPPRDKSSIRNELNLPANAIIAVYVGLLAKTKGMVELASAAAKLAQLHSDFHLVCVGSDWFGAAQRFLDDFNSNQVHMVGEKAPEEVPRYLQAADFFVFPSHSEGMPQAVLEAMHCALPIVATDVGGTSEAVAHEDNGLLVPPKDAEKLFLAMQRMVDDQSFRKMAGERSVAIVAEKFDSRINAEKLANVFRRLKEETTE